jgi:hypothetical protein
MRLRLATVSLPCLSLALVACGPGGGDTPGECVDDLIISGDLVITEVFADADGPTTTADDGREWFEVYNNADRPLDLEGLTITYSRPDGSGTPKTHVIATSTTLPANSYLVLGNTLPDLVPSWVDYGYADGLGDLNNTDGKFTLTCGAREIDSAVYDMVDPGLSRQFDGGGLPDYTANDDLANWCAATPEAGDEFDPENFGTPGSPNEDCEVIVAGQCNDGGTMRDTVPPAPGDLVITEVMPSPEAVGDDLGEWFEVLVTRDVDLNGVGLDRGGDTSNPNLIESEDCLAVTAGTLLVFARSSDMAVNGGLPAVTAEFRFTMVSGSVASPGDVQLMLGTTTIDGFTWTRSSNGESLQVDPDSANAVDNDLEANWCNGTVAYGAGDLGTPGAMNAECATIVPPGMCVDEGTGNVRNVIKPTAGEIVITEWMPNPSLVNDNAGEWVEVQALAAFDLNGLQLGDAALATSPVVTASTCVPIASGAYALFAQGSDPLVNGMLPPVDGTFPTGVDLVNTNGTVQVGIDGAPLDMKTWVSSAAALSIQIDTDGTQCNAPATTPLYNGIDAGTPEAVHAAECP